MQIVNDVPSCGDTTAHRWARDLLRALGHAARARGYVRIASAHISGVSYWNLGETGLHFLETLAETGARACVPATLNPCAFFPPAPPDWVSEEDIRSQARVLSAYEALGVQPSCTCAPYRSLPPPLFGEHAAWAESSAATFANSVLGVRTEREGGPAALAAALCGYVPFSGLHLDENRRPDVALRVRDPLQEPWRMGLLGAWLGQRFPGAIPFLYVPDEAPCSIEGFQALSAALVTYGGEAMFCVAGRTPEAGAAPPVRAEVGSSDLDALALQLSDLENGPIDMVFLGCPHGSSPSNGVVPPLAPESARARLVIACAPVRAAKFPGFCLPGGCPAVSVLAPGVRRVVTDSAKAAFYLRSRGLRVGLASTDACFEAAITGRWSHAR